MSADDPADDAPPAEGEAAPPRVRRRSFLTALAATGRVAAGGAAVLGAQRLWGRQDAPEGAPAGQSPVRPPGATSEQDFLARCIGCYLCGEVCPPACIQFPSAVQGVDVGLRRPRTGFLRDAMVPPRWQHPGTPYVLPWVAGCILCMECARVCPTGALRPPEPTPEAEYGDTRMGKAVVDEKICLPFNRISWCGACYTACPLKNVAIEVDYRNRPKVLEGCVGCGLCVEACPIRYKAIAIDPPFSPDQGRVRKE